ncbi:lycopene cyclase [Sphingomonas ginkgonis]|uniref:Lycopene cyclase n=1 Tax=Sphingomonas ginkgonis TaxID=2315330 RepID=A0A3S0ENB0_9SPHN|nr:lycopene beta-cyclase CrtY [Sphingomonas ginkgonis]RST31479.1 lycopene cyclase [Sphingomonas ginkgonis]
MSRPRSSLIIAGGGLAGGLCALAMAARRPDVQLTLIEPGDRIGGHHLWSFFDSDIAPDQRWLVDPLVARRWPANRVRFPAYERRLSEPYSTIESERLDAAVRAALPASRIVAQGVSVVEPAAVTLDDGTRLTADAVLDARGARLEGLHAGWQKFVGVLLKVKGGHGVAEPVIMDAAVDQSDGYRFVYLLPFDPDTLFVEDTYYHDQPELDREALGRRIEAYAAAQGWQVEGSGRSEHGVLPVLTGGDFERFWPAGDRVARAGTRGGFFHPLTSYSLPDAVRFAAWLVDQPLDGLGAATRTRAERHWKRSAYDRMLARMLFRAAEPAQRYRVLERFYRLPESLIARFYGGTSSVADRIRLLAGKPPVPIGRALHALRETE